MTEPAAARALGFAFICFGASVASCSRSGAANTYLARADTLLAQKKYGEVIQQSRRALDANHHDSRATALLARAHLELGDYNQAYQNLLDARRLDPGDRTVRLELASYYMIEGQPEQSREQAAMVARADSANLAAWILLGATARSPRQLDEAIRNLSRTWLSPDDSARARIALATLQLRNRDSASAASLLHSTVARDTESLEAKTVLASYFALTGQAARAERERASLAARMPPQSARRVELAKFLVSLGYRAEAKRWLADVPPIDSTGVVARRLLIELQLADGDSAALHSISELLQRDPQDAEVLVQRGRFELGAHQTLAAAADLRNACRLAPGLATAHYYLALAELDTVDTTSPNTTKRPPESRALNELDTAVTLAASYPEALFKRADLEIRFGKGRTAISDLDRFIAENPGSIRGHELLAAALAASGRAAEATETFHRLIDVDPDRAESHYELGVSLQTAGNTTAAVQEFERALALAPAYADPMTQLVLLDLAANKPAAALERISQQLARAPQSGPLYDLLGLVHATRNELTAAESAYRRAVQLQPALVDARVRLAELYDATGRYDEAIAEADTARKFEPKNVRILMALGVGYQQRGETAQAREAYEAALAVSPGFAGAANNLAYLLSDQPGQQDKAYEYASLAKRIAPNDPHVADTFGWILYKRGDYARAMTILKQAAARLADSPAALYHLGMTAQKVGDTDTARAALTKAVAAPTDFPGKDEARRALAQLK